jgi:hypothetical protein
VAQVEGSALVAQAIQREGIEALFDLAGGPIQDIMGFAPHCGVWPIGVHHEQAATFAAAAYGYVKNQVGVAVLAAGPGVSNGVTGAHVAYDNCLPLVILGGSGPQRARYTSTFQETENIPMFKGITKMAVQVDSTARLPEYMAMAFRKARTGRPGPVYLDLPSDVLQNAVDEERVRWPECYYTQARPLGDPDQVKRAATQPAAYWLQRLVEADIPCTLVQDYHMLAQDPQTLENSYLYNYEHSRFGTLKAVGPVAYFSKTGSVPQGPAPGEPGQHTQAILANAGFTSEEIAQLRANKVVS